MKSLLNQHFVKKVEICEDVSDQYDMLLELLYEAIEKYIPRLSLTTNKLSRKTIINRLLNLKYGKSIDNENYTFRQTTSMFITNIVNLVIKYVFLRDSPSKILKNIFVMMLKIILKYLESMLATKEKPLQACHNYTNQIPIKKYIVKLIMTKLKRWPHSLVTFLLYKEKTRKC